MPVTILGVSEAPPMGRLFTAAITFGWLSAQPILLGAHQVGDQSHFQPAETLSVSDVTIPIRSVASGTVVLNVTISKKGEVGDVRVRHDIASETDVAVRSARQWKFKPAKLNGKAVASRMTVAVTFNPAPPVAGDIPLPPLIPQENETRLQPSFQPPGVIHATFPTYPVRALNPGTVILQARLNEAGEVQSTMVLRDAPPFTATATRAIEDWRFVPATLNGRPVESNIVLVFCFRQPVRVSP
jgi:TonB family protein